MSRTKLRILFLEFEYEVLCRLQAESEAVMGLINKEKVLRGVGKAVDAANNAADKVHDYAKEKEGLSGSRILTLFGMRPPAFGLPQV